MVSGRAEVLRNQLENKTDEELEKLNAALKVIFDDDVLGVLMSCYPDSDNINVAGMFGWTTGMIEMRAEKKAREMELVVDLGSDYYKPYLDLEDTEGSVMKLLGRARCVAQRTGCLTEDQWDRIAVELYAKEYDEVVTALERCFETTID